MCENFFRSDLRQLCWFLPNSLHSDLHQFAESSEVEEHSLRPGVLPVLADCWRFASLLAMRQHLAISCVSLTALETGLPCGSGPFRFLSWFGFPVYITFLFFFLSLSLIFRISCHSSDIYLLLFWASRTRLPMQETQQMWVRSVGREDPLGEEMAPHSSILAWEIPWTEEPGGLQFLGLQSLAQPSIQTRIFFDS